MSLTRDEAVEKLSELEADLQREVELCQTRDQHLRAAGNLGRLRSIVAELRGPDAVQ